MNKEFEDWIDQKLAKYASGSAITKDVLMSIVKDALVDVSTAEEVMRLKNEGLKAGDCLAQLRIIKDEVLEKIVGCCGVQAGKIFCENYGCGTLHRIAVQIQSAIQFVEKKT